MTSTRPRANLNAAKSNLAFTEADFTRGQALVRDKTITDQTFEQRSQAFRNSQASVANNEAASGRPNSISNSREAPRAGQRPHWRPPRVAG